MKNNYLIFILCCILYTGCKKDHTINAATATTSLKPKTLQSTNTTTNLKLKVLQLNVWQEGTKVTGGFNGIIDAIIQSGADLITLSEVRNYNNKDFSARVVSALQAKNLTFYSFKDNNVGIVSRYPIASFKAGIYGNAFDKAIVKLNVNTEVAVYSAHLDYLNYACYLPRGYDGNSFQKISQPVTDVNAILASNLQSTRDEEIAAFVNDAKLERDSGRIVILGGDFNEPSHLDWVSAQKDLFDHHGTIVPWQSSVTLYAKGYKDAYRVKNPDPVQAPGFTWAAFNTSASLSSLVWAPDADERDRIDYIYYADNSNRVTVDQSIVFGPSGSIVRGQGYEDPTYTNPFLIPSGTWPSDHKGLITTFSIISVQPAISLNKTTYSNGETVTVTFANGSTDTKAWIGIYQNGKVPGSGSYATTWKYTNGAGSGSMALTLPANSAAGTYFVAYFKDNGYIEIAPRVSFNYGG
ncbi:endonuclease/exonuclease/phosphatase family protein [Pedobacter sp. GSP4]|uniref:endonuclease/exonuclease/phosphatase family protein n=1 Tax=Pedobacter sp. GSP4 TaxID=3453716 RepID=UPI003EEC799B